MRDKIGHIGDLRLKFVCFSAFFKDKLNVFYVLAFLPLVLIAYFDMLRAVIPAYGFLILYMKKHKLSLFSDPNNIQKGIGLMILFGSFFPYYLLVPLFPSMFYWGANYALTVLGLFLIFFAPSALKEAFSAIFLILAGISSSFIAVEAESFLSFVVPPVVSLLASILTVFGLDATTTDPYTILVHGPVGESPLLVSWSCVGFYSVLVFSIILVVILFEDESGIKTKISWGIFGVLGTMVVNVIRLILVLLVAYFYGLEVEATFHYFIGYVLFIAWLMFFLYVFSNRRGILRKIRSRSVLSLHALTTRGRF